MIFITGEKNTLERKSLQKNTLQNDFKNISPKKNNYMKNKKDLFQETLTRKTKIYLPKIGSQEF